jgi:glycerophosphoryl diester phosphodiesterase
VPLGDDRVPLLADVLAWARERHQRVNVELKSDVSRPLALLRGVKRVVRATGVGPELVLFSSFQPAFVAALRVLVPELPGAWLVDRDDRFTRRAPAFRLVADGVNPHRELVAGLAMTRWKRHGAPIATWTVNEPDEARRVAALGVDTIISDKPGEILRALGG